MGESAVRRLLLVAAVSITAAVPAHAQAQAPPETLVRVCSESALRQAIADTPSGGTVRFACDGTVVMVGVVDPFEVVKDLTFDATGRRVVISGGGRNQIFFLSGGGKVTMRGFTVTGGNVLGDGSQGGGAVIVANTTLALDRMRFVGNYADNRGGAISTINRFSSVESVDSEFTGNSIGCGTTCIDGGGGAVSLAGGRPSRFERTLFRENSTFGRASGGAILGRFSFNPSLLGAITILDSAFEENSASTISIDADRPPNGGGAVASYNRPLTIEGSRFTGNVTAPGGLGGFEDFGGRGGAVRVSSAPDAPGLGPVRVADSVFTGNRAPGQIGEGGAITVDRAPLDVVRTQIIGNSAAEGGGLSGALGPAITITDSRIVGNTAAGSARGEAGGGIDVSRSVVFSGTDVAGNAPDQCRTFTFDPLSPPVLTDAGANFESPGSTCGFGAITRPTLAVGDVAVREPEAGETARGRLTLTLSPALALPLRVAFSTIAGTAVAGEDFDAAAGELTIPAGATTATVPVDVRGDDAAESARAFDVQLSLLEPGRTQLAGDGRGTVTITDDDAPPPPPQTTTVTTTTTTPAETTTVTIPGPPPAPQPPVVGPTPPPAACVSARQITLVPGRVLRSLRGSRVLGATRTSIMGKRGIPLLFTPRRVYVDLRGLPKGRFTVLVRLRLRGGERVTLVRRYQTCAGEPR